MVHSKKNNMKPLALLENHPLLGLLRYNVYLILRDVLEIYDDIHDTSLVAGAQRIAKEEKEQDRKAVVVTSGVCTICYIL